MPKNQFDHLYKYKVVSVDRLPQLQERFNRLDEEGKLSDHPTFREYVNELEYTIPEELPQAKSIIIMAFYIPLLLVDFEFKERTVPIFLPPQYFISGISQEAVMEEIRQEIIKSKEAALLPNQGMPLKLLAVHSGLGKYGRNNICYVDEMGTFLQLRAYFTDYEFPEYDWEEEVQLMDLCKKCRVCLEQCPTKALNEDNFVINVGNCITLYNEVDVEFPSHIQAAAHNSLMGCMRCQLLCPANKQAVAKQEFLVAIPHAQTERILAGDFDDDLRADLADKLRGYPPAGHAEYNSIFTRNLNAIIR